MISISPEQNTTKITNLFLDLGKGGRSLFDPGVVEDLFEGRSLSRVYNQHVLQQQLGLQHE